VSGITIILNDIPTIYTPATPFLFFAFPSLPLWGEEELLIPLKGNKELEKLDKRTE